VIQRRTFILNSLSVSVASSFGLSGCGSSDDPLPQNSFAIKNLAANDTKYAAKYTLPEMIDA
jgi:uncharacterized protein (TIGR03118 family)